MKRTLKIEVYFAPVVGDGSKENPFKVDGHPKLTDFIYSAVRTGVLEEGHWIQWGEDVYQFTDSITFEGPSKALSNLMTFAFLIAISFTS